MFILAENLGRSKQAEGALEASIIQLEDHLNKLLNCKETRLAEEGEEVFVFSFEA